MNPEPDKISAPTSVDVSSQALADAMRNSFAIVKVVMGALLIAFLFSGCFTVGPQENAIVLRFGKPVGEGTKRLVAPGLHWGFPYPIDEVVKIPITRSQQVKSTVGWFEQTALQEAAGEEPPPRPSLNPAVDGYALTADGNIVHVRVTLTYKVEDPVQCVFEYVGDNNGRSADLSGVSRVVQNAVNNALLYSAAHYKVDDILTRDKAGFQDDVRRRVVKLLEAQKVGVSVDTCTVVSRPPRQVQGAFELVLATDLARSKAIEEARSYTNQILSRAEADATVVKNLAAVDRTRIIADVKADARQFEALQKRFEENRQLFVQQRMVETMARVMTNVTDKIYLPTSGNGKTEVRLQLNREAPKARPAGQ